MFLFRRNPIEARYVRRRNRVSSISYDLKNKHQKGKKKKKKTPNPKTKKKKTHPPHPTPKHKTPL